MASDLSDLVETPRETLEIELKEWLDLDEAVVRANIARHLAALANHGGGYLIFGFKDDLTLDQSKLLSRDKYSRDTFSGIVKRYLTPAFQCEVLNIANKNSQEFIVVSVPSHGRTPIAAKADGPQDEKGRVQGISKGTYYIRKPGPESAPIIGAEEWGALIRRCVLNDRDNLLNDIAGLVQSSPKAELAAKQKLADWHRLGEERFLQLLSQAKAFRWPVSLKDNRYQLSYLISAQNGEAFSEGQLQKILEEVNHEVRSAVWTGWSMFYPFKRPEIAPAFHPEHLDGTGSEIFEANLLGDDDFQTSLPDFWRVAADGRVTLVRAYREDRERSVKEVGRAAGTWLSPETVIRETTEFVTHARFLARRLESATHVTFRCTWTGLAGRELNDFLPDVYWSPGQIAKANQRTVDGEWPVSQLGAMWSTIVADIGCPILRLFGFTGCNSAFVERMAPKFVKF